MYIACLFRFLLVLFNCLLVYTETNPQSTIQIFNYGANHAYGIKVDSKRGYFYIVGDTDHIFPLLDTLSIDGYFDAVVTKVDLQGTIIWSVAYGGPKAQTISNLCIDDAGNLYLAAYTSDPFDPSTGPDSSKDYRDFMVTKMNSSGFVVWNTVFGERGVGETGYGVAYSVLDVVAFVGNGALGELAFLGGSDGTVLKRMEIGTYLEGVCIGENDTVVYVFGEETGDTSVLHGKLGALFVAKVSLSGSVLWIRYSIDDYFSTTYASAGDFDKVNGRVYSAGKAISLTTSYVYIFVVSYDIDGNLIAQNGLDGIVEQYTTFPESLQINGVAYNPVTNEVHVTGHRNSAQNLRIPFVTFLDGATLNEKYPTKLFSMIKNSFSYYSDVDKVTGDIFIPVCNVHDFRASEFIIVSNRTLSTTLLMSLDATNGNGASLRVIKYPSLLPQESQSISSNTLQISLLIEILVGIVAFVLIAFWIGACLIKKWTKGNNPTKELSDKFSVQTEYTENCTNMTSNTLFTKMQGLSIPGYFQVTRSEFSFKQQIAKGGSGEIYLIECKTSNTRRFGDVAVCKVIANNYDELIPEGKQAFDQELSIMSMLNDYNQIVKLVGYCLQPCCILMKLYQMSLDVWIYKKLKYDYTRSSVLFTILEITKGISAIHMNSLAHCDIKPQNILISFGKEMSVVITDFGITQILSEDIIHVKNFKVINLRGLSYRYAAPEVFSRLKSRLPGKAEVIKAGDVYAFSIVLFEMLCRTMPW